MANDKTINLSPAEYKYFAFISYSTKDKAWGRRIQQKLESYRMPATMCSEHGWQRKPMKPVFFDKTDIQPGDLNAELQARLKASRNLIVICSPNSAKSKYVGEEIAYFHSLGRTDNIHFFIVDGEPHSGDEATECFNPVIERLGIPEILGANIHEKASPWPWINKERAFVQLITKLLGVEFDTIWQRHKRMMIRKAVAWCVGIIAVIAALIGVLCYTQPVDVKLKLNETSVHNDHLPKLKDAAVTLTIDNETKYDTLVFIDDVASFANIPYNAIGKEAHIIVACENWLTTDTTVILSKDVTLNIARDPHPFGDIRFRLWDVNNETTFPNTSVTINGHNATADAEGIITYTMPLAEQDTVYKIEAPIQLESDTLYMPTTESTIITIKQV